MQHTLNVSVILEATRLAFADEMNFPQTLVALGDIGVERYVADLTRLDKTHYGAHGETVTDPLPLNDAPAVAEAWSAAGIVQALRSIQQGEIDYPTFLRQIMTAGCAFYWVFLRGHKAIYFSRQGDFHIENFPTRP